MIGGQHLVEALLVFGDIRLEGFDLRFRLIERVLPGMDLVRDALHFPAALGEGLLGCCLLLAKTEEPSADLGLADAHLLPHGIVALDPAFDGGAAVQHADHVIFRTADKGSRLCQLLIEGGEFLLRLLLLPADLPKGPGHFPELLLPLRFFPAAAADLRGNGFPAAAVVLPAHLDGANLLPEDLRIAAQGLAAEGALRGLLLEIQDPVIDRLDLLLQLIVFRLGGLEGRRCLLKVRAGDPGFLRDPCKLVIRILLLQQEIIDLQLLQLFLFVQINFR